MSSPRSKANGVLGKWHQGNFVGMEQAPLALSMFPFIPEAKLQGILETSNKEIAQVEPVQELATKSLKNKAKSCSILVSHFDPRFPF